MSLPKVPLWRQVTVTTFVTAAAVTGRSAVAVMAAAMAVAISKVAKSYESLGIFP